jgi:hypothetical protein
VATCPASSCRAGGPHGPPLSSDLTKEFTNLVGQFTLCVEPALMELLGQRTKASQGKVWLEAVWKNKVRR